MRQMVIASVLGLAASAALAAPRVSKADLAALPDAWRAEWRPYEAKLTEERADESTARSAVAEAQGEYESAVRARASAEQLVKALKKEVKKAKKSKDTAATAATATARAEAERTLDQAERDESKWEAALGLAQAKLELERAETRLAQAELAQLQAQAVADNGGWIEVDRFDMEVGEAKAQIVAAKSAVRKAEARVVLAAQGG